MSPRNQFAFSLIELLVVLSVVSVMMVVAVPAMKTAGKDRAGTAAPVMAGLFNAARETAIARNTYVWLCLGNSEMDTKAVIVASRSGLDALNWSLQGVDLDERGDLEIFSRVETLTGVNIADQASVSMPSIAADSALPLAAASLSMNQGGKKTVFTRVIQFSPAGTASRSEVVARHLEMVILSPLQPNDPGQAVFRINGLTGKVMIHRL